MDEKTIREYMLGNPVTKDYFLGVMSFQELPDYFPEHSGFYIVNTDVAVGEGLHWVVIRKSLSGEMQFFDSLGHNPKYYNPEIEYFLIRSGTNYVMSNKRIQGNSSLCGDYALIFCYLLSSGMTFEDFLAMFNENYVNNDIKIKLF